MVKWRLSNCPICFILFLSKSYITLLHFVHLPGFPPYLSSFVLFCFLYYPFLSFFSLYPTFFLSFFYSVHINFLSFGLFVCLETLVGTNPLIEDFLYSTVLPCYCLMLQSAILLIGAERHVTCSSNGTTSSSCQLLQLTTWLKS